MTDTEARASETLKRVSGEVYGVRVQGELPAGFERYLRSPAGHPSAREASITASCRFVNGLPDVDEFWATDPTPQRLGRFALCREPAGVGLRFSGDGEGLFRITPELIRIEWLADGPGPAHHFFSYALPLWLESRGVPVLHASAVSFGDRAVAFIGPSGVGKSTLCAGLVRSGCGFVADDGLPLWEEAEGGDWRCGLGPPWLRLWPSALERGLGIAADSLPRVQDSLEKRLLSCPDEGAVRRSDRPGLAAVYLLDGLSQKARAVTISACSTRDALVRLIEHSLAGAPAAALGWSAARLARLARAATRTPVKRLRYPIADGAWQLVSQAITRDIGTTGP